ncbi:unnamed protein product [Miscanthus lutarioriparius]|uniref:La protein 1 n=1 Tax=Miscanthus lutarioriparius TaxID=422564 RepID=A0A811QWG0_9POAL|nr:unnamed protein product [Miscanthus lutarioriparius]
MTAAAAAPLDDAKAKNVIRQVEFYFSDSNLPRDGFLRRTVEESEDGLASLALICSFSRMRSHLGLEGDVKPDTVPEETVLAVADVLRRSTALRVSEDGKKVGRSKELLKPDEVNEQVDSRTVAASPLPYNVKLEEVESFFAQCGKVNSVRLPRHVSDKRHFCGTALVEFSDEDEAKGRNLILKERQRKKHTKSHILIRVVMVKGLILAFKLKKIAVDSETEKNGGGKVDDTDLTKNEGASDATEKSSVENEEKIPENKGNVSEEQSDAVEELKGVSAGETSHSVDKDDKSPSDNDQDTISREDLKEEFTKFGTVRYVDFSIGEDSGFIRFEDSTAADKARAFAAIADEGGLTMKGHIVTLEPVSGQAEKDYWSAIRGGQEKYKDSRNNRGRDWKNNRGGKPFGGGKRGRHFDSRDRASNKAQKV